MAQISGQKRWRLWSPSSALKKSSLRVPYEESSVYNEVDPLNKAVLKEYPPDYDFLLDPGDILIVPKHWWHFVETESEFSLSVNTWQEHSTDSDDRLIEAMTRFCFGSFLSTLKDTKYFGGKREERTFQMWVNPSEVDEDGDDTVTDHAANFEYVTESMQQCGVENPHEQMRNFIKAMLKPDAIKRCLRGDQV